jgi:hypothetical protein
MFIDRGSNKPSSFQRSDMCPVPNIAPLKGCGVFRNALVYKHITPLE